MSKSIYVCQNCGAQAAKWIGRCPSCGEWNTYVEEVVQKSQVSSRAQPLTPSKPLRLPDIESHARSRIQTGVNEFDRVVGGGLVPGALVLIGGEPGIGKSTLVLQLALKLTTRKVLYVSGEESPEQLKLRAGRIGEDHDGFFLLSETSLDNLLRQVTELNPDLLIIDSIQTMVSERAESSAGTITQIRECTAEIMKQAKSTNLPVILIGHINKEGHLAGPKVLEHIVDTVLRFEGDHQHQYRVLRSLKNRYGSTDELGIFEMSGSGLLEVPNPSEFLLSCRDTGLSGNAISVFIEGQRPMLIEIQALVSSSVYATPQRTTTGFDNRRLNMLLAVLEKRAGFKLSSKDVFINMAGGLRVTDPAADLAVVAAILSSDKNLSLGQNICFTGEIGLSGEIRPVNRIDQRISEATRLGFERILIPFHNRKGLQQNRYKIEITPVRHMGDLIKQLI
ncbi:MAG: DNA repair protein RadA [Bacteroidales bacterium]|nr:DNA repair protein RadA [Bacteroidales bacterium]